VARVPASAGGKHACLRLPHRLLRTDLRAVLHLATRRIEYIAYTSNPDGRWVTQQARNLVMQLATSTPSHEHPFLFLVHDRDTKFSRVPNS
jgi:hypothetical protein